MALGEGENLFSRYKNPKRRLRYIVLPLSAVALSKGGNPFQKKRRILKRRNSTLLIYFSAETIQNFHAIQVKLHADSPLNPVSRVSLWETKFQQKVDLTS